jgi:hypothetical protein
MMLIAGLASVDASTCRAVDGVLTADAEIPNTLRWFNTRDRYAPAAPEGQVMCGLAAKSPDADDHAEDPSGADEPLCSQCDVVCPSVTRLMTVEHVARPLFRCGE